MSWASRRRFYIGFGLIATAVVAIALIGIATFYQAPTCSDNKQDGDETGVDCGGASCTYLCTAQVQAPSVSFVRQLSPDSGRTDVVAYVVNPNPSAAARSAVFTIDLYGPDGVLIASQKGTADLPPNSRVPIYVPDFFSGFQPVARAFLTFDQSSLHWYSYKDTRAIPTTSSPSIENASAAPRITATLTNPSPLQLYSVKVIATVFDTDGNAIDASQTVLPQIPATGNAQATFTWNAPFSGSVARVDILPLIPLPNTP